MKHCKKCKLLKSLDSFNKNPGMVDGLRTTCKDCQKLYDQAQYNKNKTKRNDLS